MTLSLSPDTVFSHPARILTPTMDVDRLTALAMGKVYDPAILTGRELFFFPAEISSDRLDFYFTRMAETSLRNYAAEAAEGRSFQNSHKWGELGCGMTLTGDFETVADGVRVLSWVYTVSGLKLNSLGTDDLIAGIRAGLIRDVSIGFFGGRHACSICGRDMLWDWDCPHIPGMSYPRADKTGTDLAFAWVEDAHLAEVSAVYDGATPGAAILKAQRAAEEGTLDDRGRRLLEARYRIALPTKRIATLIDTAITAGEPAPTSEELPMFRDQIVWSGDNGTLARAQFDAIFAALETAQADVSLLRSAAESGKQEREAMQARLEQAQAELTNAKEMEARALAAESAQADLQARLEQAQAAAANLSEVEARAVTAEAGLAGLQAEIDQLRPRAADGEQYRVDLITEALAEGVRALGEHFSPETYEPLLRSASLEVIKRMRDDWRRQGDQVFTGGRKTANENTPSALPDDSAKLRAFKA